MSWSDPEIAKLKSLHAKGMSAGEIAREFRGKTRNAIIGKLHRIGLAAGGGPKPPKVKRDQMKAKATRKAAFVPPPAKLNGVKVKPDELKGTVALVNLKWHHCRWPFGDDPSKMLFCGEPKVEGASYCGHHLYRATRSAA